MFEKGDAVVHPTLGAGFITGKKELSAGGTPRQYYKIRILRKTPTNLLIPVEEAEEKVRIATPESRLKEIWNTLRDEPQTLPQNHRTRFKVLSEKLAEGDIHKVAETVRDLAWRRHKREKGLTTRSKRLLRKGVQLLATELAAARDDLDLEKAKKRVRRRVRESVAARAETS